jgi:hypothetical protein
LKKTLAALASLALVSGFAGTATAATSTPTAKAPPAVSAATQAADLSKLKADLSKLGNAKLTAAQAKSLGLQKASSKDVARLKQLQKQNSSQAKASHVGSYFWYTWHNARNSWVDRFYSGPYYSYPWYPYYVIYDNFITCNYSGTGCIDADAYTYQYYLYYYPNGTWYFYNTCSYQSDSISCSGWGPYSS